jgi:uncharacterized protein YuzE
MGALKILGKQDNVEWDYDEDADVLYVSIGSPRQALGIDIGEGLVIRYDDAGNEGSG